MLEFWLAKNVSELVIGSIMIILFGIILGLVIFIGYLLSINKKRKLDQKINENIKKYSKSDSSQATTIELPCPIGAQVYSIRWWKDKYESKVIDGKLYTRLVRKYILTRTTFSLNDLDEFGKEIFLDKNEALEALKKKNKEVNE